MTGADGEPEAGRKGGVQGESEFSGLVAEEKAAHSLTEGTGQRTTFVGGK